MKRTGITILELIIVLAIVAVFAVLCIPNFLHESARHPFWRVKADQRSVATALEVYYVDNGQYPGWQGDPPTFATMTADWPYWTLTTPVAYMTNYPKDPLAEKGQTFCYYADREAQGWILWSPGPDKDLDLTLKIIRALYRARMPDDAPELLVYAYDPSNGTESSGDVYRVMMQAQTTTSPTTSRQ